MNFWLLVKLVIALLWKKVNRRPESTLCTALLSPAVNISSLSCEQNFAIAGWGFFCNVGLFLFCLFLLSLFLRISWSVEVQRMVEQADLLQWVTVPVLCLHCPELFASLGRKNVDGFPHRENWGQWSNSYSYKHSTNNKITLYLLPLPGVKSACQMQVS